MAQQKLLLDSNAYLRLARSIHPLLFVEFGEDRTCLYLAEADELGRVGARARTTEPGNVDHLLLLQPVAAVAMVSRTSARSGAARSSGHSPSSVPALAHPVHHPGRVGTRGVTSRLAELQSRGVRTWAGRPQAGGGRGNHPAVDGHLQLLARRVEACYPTVVEPESESRNPKQGVSRLRATSNRSRKRASKHIIRVPVSPRPSRISAA